jgi:hypothetical protein
MTALANIEPIALPEAGRPTMMPSLPGWVATRVAALEQTLQRDPETGRYRQVWTLPATQILEPGQRMLIEQHVVGLRRFMEQTPERSQDAENATLVILMKLFQAKPAPKTTEAGAEAKIEAYMDALDDVPCWAVRSAVRLWNRGQCDHVASDDGRALPAFTVPLDRRAHHNYDFAPGSAILRKLSVIEASLIRGRALEMQRLLDAVPLIEYSEKEKREMRGKLATIMPWTRFDCDLPKVSRIAAAGGGTPGCAGGNDYPAPIASGQPQAPPHAPSHEELLRKYAVTNGRPTTTLRPGTGDWANYRQIQIDRGESVRVIDKQAAEGEPITVPQAGGEWPHDHG